MRGRDVPSGVPETCMHKFRRWFYKISRKKRKIIRTKYLLELKKIIVSTISNMIFFIKEYFPPILSLWPQLKELRWRFLDFKDQLKSTSGVFSNKLVQWRRMHVAILLAFIELVGRFDEVFSFVVKLLFSYKVAFGFYP